MAPSPAVAALQAALDAATGAAAPNAAAPGGPAQVLAAFWARIDRDGTPLVEEVLGAPGERIVTFLWRDRHGTGPGTRGVLLLANKLTDPTVPEHSALERLEGTDVWHRAFRLASSWRGTYALAPDDGDAPVEDAALGPASRWRGVATRAQPDPRNPRSFPGVRGGCDLSVLELPDAPPQTHVKRGPGVPVGTVTAHEVPGLDDVRRAWVHVPAGTTGRPHRLLVLLDGDEWIGRRDAPAILDALHHDGLVPPLVTLMLDGRATADRWGDMTAGAPYLDLLTRTLPDWARAHVPALRDEAPGGILVAGSSLGGLAALRAALHAPDRVAGVLAQSASLWFPDQAAADAPSPTVRAFAAAPGAGASAAPSPVGAAPAAPSPTGAASARVRFHVEVGRDEWVLLPAHRALRDVLVARGDDHVYVEYEGGHDALCWRGGLADGLRSLTRDGLGGGRAPSGEAARPAPAAATDDGRSRATRGDRAGGGAA
ncbi:enterochelin esterase [Patulibacter americanus]|uniref:enterochelin esterase n=1 Tax=Patulibacter americanus TaxID=588672 RepID=UPI00040148E3|nr:enterochelin esterase [Patulibacter americanus]